MDQLTTTRQNRNDQNACAAEGGILEADVCGVIVALGADDDQGEPTELVIEYTAGADELGADGAYGNTVSEAAEPIAVQYAADALAYLAYDLYDAFDGDAIDKRILLVGGALDGGAGIAQAVTKYTTEVQEALGTKAEDLQPDAKWKDVKSAITAALESPVAGVTFTMATGFPMARCSNEGVEAECVDGDPLASIVDVELKGDLTFTGDGTGVAFDTGIPSLQLKSNTVLTPDLTTRTMDLHFGIEKGIGPYLEASEDAEPLASIAFNASLPLGACAMGSVYDLGAGTPTGARCIDAVIGSFPATLFDLGDTMVANTTTVDLGERATFGGMAAKGLNLTTAVSGNGLFHAQFETWASAAGFYDVGGHVYLEWDTDDPDYGDTRGFGSVEYSHLVLDKGTFDEMLQPLFGDIDAWLAPFRPVLDTLRQPIPLISDMSRMVGGPNLTMLTLMRLKGANTELVENVIKFSDAMSGFANPDARGEHLISLANGETKDDAAGTWILGEFKLEVESEPGSGNGDGDEIKELLINQHCGRGQTEAEDDQVGAPRRRGRGVQRLRFQERRRRPPQTHQAGREEGASFESELSGSISVSLPSISFPVLNDAEETYDMLLGDADAVLVRADFGEIVAEIGYNASYRPIMIGWVPVDVFAGGSITATGRFSMGFDAHYLSVQQEKLVDPGDPKEFVELLSTGGLGVAALHGLFIDDLNSEGVDVPEIEVVTTISAGAAISIKIIRVGIEGGVEITIEFDASDFDGDGKIRIDDVQAASSAGGYMCMFSVEGSLFFFLKAFLEVDLGFWSWDKRFTILQSPKISLFEFRCKPVEPKLATEELDGDLILHIGDDPEYDRGFRDADTDERFVVRQVSESRRVDGYEWPTIRVSVSAFDREQFFEVKEGGRIYAWAGVGQDTLRFEPGELDGDTEGSVVPIPFTVPVCVDGGEGADTIVTGDGDDIVLGGDGADTIDLFAGTDLAFGGGGDDAIRGVGGDDLLYGQGSPASHQLEVSACDGLEIPSETDLAEDATDNDRMQGGAGVDRVFGGPGNDEIDGGPGVHPDADMPMSAIVFGTEINSLPLLDGGDLLVGGSGADSIDGSFGTDTIDGGEGLADALTREIVYAGDSILVNAFEDDPNITTPVEVWLRNIEPPTLEEQAAACLSGAYDPAASPTELEILSGGPDRDYLFGGNGNDALDGGGGEDLMCGRNGDDHLIGDGAVEDGGADEMYGGVGRDRLFGDDGDDVLYGEEDADSLHGGNGEDTILGGAGPDLILGGDGSDTIYGESPTNQDEGSEVPLIGQVGPMSRCAASVLVVAGRFDINDDLSIRSGIKTPDDGFVDGFRVVGGLLLEPGPPTDVAKPYDGIIGSMVVTEGMADLNGDGAVDESDTGLIGLSVMQGNSPDGDCIMAGGGDDVEVYGGLGGDWIEGGSGLDILRGEAGPDFLRGNADDDRLYGGTDDDTLVGDPGHDVLEGNEGNDRLWGSEGDDFLIGGSQDADRSDGEDTLFGGRGDDILAGQNAIVKQSTAINLGIDGIYAQLLGQPETEFRPEEDDPYWDEMYGGFGNDWLFGQDGNDLVRGGHDDDYVEGNAGDDRVQGDDHNDIVIGGSSANQYGVISADRDGSDHPDGNDTLFGDAGADGLDGDDVLLGDNGRVDNDGTLLGVPKRTITMPASATTGVSAGTDVLRGNGGFDILVGQREATARRVPADVSCLAEDVETLGDLLCGDGGSDVLIGDTGTVDLRPATEVGTTQSLEINGVKNTVIPAFQPGEIIPVVELEFGTGGDDILMGGDGIDWLHGGAGADLANGGPGDDRVFGGDDADALWGGLGNDRLYGGHGNTPGDSLDVKPMTTSPDLWSVVAPEVDRDGKTNPTNGIDLIHGGWGHDALQADDVTKNGPGDRLIDWAGQHNVYYVCDSSNGGNTIIRSPSNGMEEFLRVLAINDGAASDGNGTLTGSGANELGYVYPQDINQNTKKHPNVKGDFVCDD